MHSIRPVCFLLALATVGLSAQQPSAPPGFKFERPIVTGGAGPRRLPIDVPLLVGAAPFHSVAPATDPGTGEPVVAVSPGVNDLRLYDAAGAEIAHLLVNDPPSTLVFRPAIVLPMSKVDLDAKKSSGFEADLGELMMIDRLRIDGLPAPFLKRVTLEGSGDRSRWTVLVADGTVFDLPEQRLRLLDLAFPPGSYRYLRLTWDDTNSARLPPPSVVSARHLTPEVARAPALTTPIAFERRASEPGMSRFRLQLPGGRLPIVALHLAVGGGHLSRNASVFEAQLFDGALIPRRLGRATLTRVVRGSLSAADLKIAIEPPTEAQLDLEVEDGDNPPLDVRGITAEFAALPWIYFEAPEGAVTARYGNASLMTPRYDLEATRPQLHIESVITATWGEARGHSAAENADVAPPLPTVGASLDPGLFKYLRALPSGPAGLLAVSLDVGVLAHSRGVAGGFSDLRVIDAANRQIPYILERTAEPLSLDLEVAPATAPSALPPSRAERSIYRVTYPVAGLPATRLVLSTPARVFDRRVTLVQEHQADRAHRDTWIETVSDARWIHADPDSAAKPLSFAVPVLGGAANGASNGTEDTPSLYVVVDEGDNTPLPLDKVRVLLPAYRIRLFRAESTELRVAYGRDDLNRPAYDLALLTPRLLGTTATEITLEPELRVAATLPTSAIMSPRLFWAAIAIAVAVLMGLIARLVTRADEGRS